MSTGITLITGASGHLGANLVRHLLADGEQVRVMMRTQQDNGALEGLDVERVEADLRNHKDVSNAVRGCSNIYHCAALVSTIDGNAAHKREIFNTNVLGTINILKAAELHKIKKVVVSGSLSATGYEPDISSHEDMPFYPFDRHLPYGFTKHLTEHECLKAHANGLNVVIATSCAIIGPHDYVPSRMGRVLIDYANGSLRAYIPGGFEFVSSHDISVGHILAMKHGRSGQKYIFGTAYASVDDLLALFSNVTGRPLPRLRLSPFLMATLAEVADKTWYRAFPNRPRRFTPGAVRLLQMHRRASHDKAKQELGYQPTHLLQAVQEAYDDFVRRGLIAPAK
jgi:hydroxymethylglutaryl-CoA reductase/dihydroflavonol-4-reductase